VNVRDLGAVGRGNAADADHDTLAFRQAIEVARTRGRPIGIPAGTYFINEPLVYHTEDDFAQGLILFGAGMRSSTLVNLVDGEPLLSLIGGDSNGHKQWGGRIADFSIRYPEPEDVPARITDRGVIELRCQWHCDIERIRIMNCSGSGIRVVSEDTTGQGDWDSSNYLRFNNCHFDFNRGYGMHFDSIEGTLGFSNTSIEHCATTGNVLGGIRGDGVGYFVVRNCGIGANGILGIDGSCGGIYIPYNRGVSSQQIVVEECEIDSNNPYGIWLEGCIGGEISRNRFVETVSTEEWESDKKGIYIGHPEMFYWDEVAGRWKPDYGTITSLACRENWFAIGAYRANDTAPYRGSYTAFDVSKETGYPYVNKLYIEKTYWGSQDIYVQSDDFKKMVKWGGDASRSDPTSVGAIVVFDEALIRMTR
jgi:hypothetical protein